MRRVLIALLLIGLVAGAVVVGIVLVYNYEKRPLPLTDQCVATVAGDSVEVSTEQAHFASIIAGISRQRGLVPRAATIALATAYQESGLLNLDYGDRDSLGLFQQRPSQGWGTAAQVMDPWYSSNAFYAALVKVKDWQTGDVNDVAQTVQKSAHPNGYDRHVENARRLASALTGESPASFGCLVRTPPAADPSGLATFLTKTLPATSAVRLDGRVLTVRTASTVQAWSAAQIAVANSGTFGEARVEVAGMTWTPQRSSVAPWAGTRGDGRTVTVTFAG